MLATAQKLRTVLDGGVVFHTIWHRPKDPVDCAGDCDFHRILCDPDEGIIAPGGMRDVPVDISERSSLTE